MEGIHFNEQSNFFRKSERFKAAQTNGVFKLDPSEYAASLVNLHSNDCEIIRKSMELFARHYNYNPFYETPETRFIINCAVAAISQVETPIELQKVSFLFLCNVIKSSSNGFAFISDAGLLDIFVPFLSTMDNPYFDQTIIIFPRILCRDTAISGTFFSLIPIEFFIEVYNNFEFERNHDVPISIIQILFSYLVFQNETKHFSPSNNAKLFSIMDFLLFCLSSTYNQPGSFNFEITHWCILTLNLFYKLSAIFCQHQIDNILTILGEILANSIQLQTTSIRQNKSQHIKHSGLKRNRRLIVTVVNVLISLFESGSLLNESQNIIIPVFALISHNFPEIQHRALHCIDVFFRCYPDRIGNFIENSILLLFKNIFASTSYFVSKELINIFVLIMKNGHNNDQISILQNHFIENITPLMKDAENDFYLICLDLISRMLILEEKLQTNFNVHTGFIECDGLDIVSERINDIDEEIVEMSRQFLQNHFQDES